MEEFVQKGIELLTTYGGKIALAIVVLIVGSIVIKLVSKAVKKALSKSKLDKMVQTVIGKVVKILLAVVLVIGIIEILGVPMTSVVALMASGGLAIGLALQFCGRNHDLPVSPV